MHKCTYELAYLRTTPPLAIMRDKKERNKLHSLREVRQPITPNSSLLKSSSKEYRWYLQEALRGVGAPRGLSVPAHQLPARCATGIQ